LTRTSRIRAIGRSTFFRRYRLAGLGNERARQLTVRLCVVGDACEHRRRRQNLRDERPKVFPLVFRDFGNRVIALLSKVVSPGIHSSVIPVAVTETTRTSTRVVTGGDVSIEDLGGKTGTGVNGDRIEAGSTKTAFPQADTSRAAGVFAVWTTQMESTIRS
jgi:hypothetical protein